MSVNRKYIIGAVVAAVVVVGALVGISLAGGGSGGTPVSKIDGASAVQAEFSGIPASGGTIGRPSAPVEIIEYGDTSCPVCRDASATSIPQLVDQYVKTGKVKMSFRPIAFISRSSERGALAAEAAGMQNAMWPFVTLIYKNQGPESQEDWLTDPLLQETVTKLGLDVAKWKADYAGNQVATQFFARQSAANADGVTGTPFFIVKGPRGKDNFSGSVGIERFRQAISKVS